ncbi:hypothetical protein EV193_104373 [Herbihabitans rhizosphaerae]|uniref:Uncharacterized protein n=1 Tax=Herbihabitans rhizosphaerae TaxID=1872711 RepID=A0A4Q7KRQ4_9PSEU|nr:hypothetical protein [Herbihabitans rhizosphaerae]RZS39157.1 hypothetical protein EV193_104373 [Herbihabitans rhizosphaerae]
MKLEQQLREMQRKTLYSAAIEDGGLTVTGSGGITVEDQEGQKIFFTGSDPSLPLRPDGSQQSTVVVRDDAGQTRLRLWDPDPLAANGYTQAMWQYDHAGRPVFTTDVAGGLAEPWLNVPLYCMYAMAPGRYPYTYLPIADLVGNIWEGRVSYVSHPVIQVDGTWGQATGVNATDYFLDIGPSTFSWTAGLLETTNKRFDVSHLLGDRNVPIALRATPHAGSTGAVAFQVLGCCLRQT